MTLLSEYHRLERLQLPQGAICTKPGVRGYPGPPPQERVFRRALAGVGGPLVDCTGSAGAVGLLAATNPGVEIAESSMAALLCAREAVGPVAGVRAALPWDLGGGSADLIALAPPADRGNARVLAEMLAARDALRPGGTLYLALHKDQGAKRFEKRLGELFGHAEVVERDRGWRLSVAREPLEGDSSDPWLEFEAAGLPLRARPGVHAAGRLDPGTGVLAAVIPWSDLAGRRVLDLGCGYGVLALLAARRGAAVTAVDDDLAALQSVRRNAADLGLELDSRHSDIDSEIRVESFDVILCNPPFHVGRGVRLDVPRAFIAAAGRLLEPGGELWLVANRDLPYEREIAAWSEPETVVAERGFKVLRAKRPPTRR
ncbi:MAG TPA: methyltransferase [Trueperaceae bacterium]